MLKREGRFTLSVFAIGMCSLLVGCAGNNQKSRVDPNSLSIQMRLDSGVPEYVFCSDSDGSKYDCLKPTEKNVSGLYGDVSQAKQEESVNVGDVSIKEKNLILSFSVNSSTLSEAEILKIKSFDVSGGYVFLAGYTDSTGIESFNDALAKRRAESVKLAVLELWGVDEVITTYKGGCCYRYDNEGESGRDRNRRVEVFIFGTEKELNDKKTIMEKESELLFN